MVRKEGPNKGRWFYTCQESKESGCGFFLWDNDAVSREMRAVINNSRSEPVAAMEATPVSGTTTTDRRTVEGHIEAGNKWVADLIKKEEDGFGEWPLLVNDEIPLVGAAEEKAVPQSGNIYPEILRKVAKIDEFSTPGSKRKRDEAERWPTPNTGRTDPDDMFTTPSTSRLKGGMWNGNERAGLMSPSVTPTPARFRVVNHPPEAAESLEDQKDYDITKEVIDLLKDQPINGHVISAIRQALNKYALKTQGIARGRDITRMALKTKGSKISELEQRIVELQNERELDKVIIRHFKNDMTQNLGKHGRGRGKLDE
jgi:GRF zinc finger